MSFNLPELHEHTVAPPALPPIEGGTEIELALSDACRRAPVSARTLAALGNVLVRRGAYLDALEAYRSASDLDPADAPLAWMCAEIAHVLDARDTSVQYRARALAVQRVFPDPLPVGSRIPVLLLLRDAPYSDNTPLELLLDRKRVAVHKYYVEGDAAPALPHADVVMTAFGYAHGAHNAIERAALLSPAVNDSRALVRTAREHVQAWAATIDGVVAAQSAVYSGAQLIGHPLPVTIRPLDTHAGHGLALIAEADDLAAHLERFPAERYYVAPFIEYRSDDGLYRKFRVIFVDGEAYPYHYAMSLHWMVHYQSAPMEHVEAFREEEALFLNDPQRVVPRWKQTMREIADAVGLDYFGIDAGVLPDGRVVIFEADAAMLVHDEDARGVFAYKRPYVARIREALHELIARRTPQRTP
jgi:glutathione synthase/RimK-type ligase-like ATP-grasp enzyme